MTKDQEAEAILLIEDYLKYRRDQGGVLKAPEAEVHELIREVREAADDQTIEDRIESQRWFEAEFQKATVRLGMQ